MTGISIDTNDGLFKAMLSRLKKEVNALSAEVDQEIAAHTELMATSAKRMCPVDTGRLRSSISAKKDQFLSYYLIAQTDYAAYIEFGTGRYAANYVPSIEKEWQDIAIKFKGTRRVSGIPARPYMRPSINAYMPILKDKINEIIHNQK